MERKLSNIKTMFVKMSKVEITIYFTFKNIDFIFLKMDINILSKVEAKIRPLLQTWFPYFATWKTPPVQIFSH